MTALEEGLAAFPGNDVLKAVQRLLELAGPSSFRLGLKPIVRMSAKAATMVTTQVPEA